MDIGTRHYISLSSYWWVCSSTSSQVLCSAVIVIAFTLLLGHLYLADHGSTDCGSTDHMDLLFQDCTTHIASIFAYNNEHIYVYVFVCFVFVIYGTLQKKFCEHCEHKCKVLRVVMSRSIGEGMLTKPSPTLRAKCTSNLMYK